MIGQEKPALIEGQIPPGMVDDFWHGVTLLAILDIQSKAVADGAIPLEGPISAEWYRRHIERGLARARTYLIGVPEEIIKWGVAKADAHMAEMRDRNKRNRCDRRSHRDGR